MFDCLNTYFVFIYILKQFFGLLPQGNVVQLDHLCSGNNMLKCGDVLRCIIMTIANVFTLLSTDISRKWTQQHFMGGRNIIEKLVIPSNSEDSELESQEEWIPETVRRSGIS